MSIPTRSECFALMARESMPLHIGRHSVLVSQLATGLARGLVDVGLDLDVVLVERSSLLHDIGKASTLGTREDHGVIGAKIVTAEGYSELAPIVEQHVGLWEFKAETPLDEGLIVNYADKRVKHHQLVELSNRFVDLGDRYARTEKMRQLLDMMHGHYRELERVIFTLLPYDSKEVEGHLSRDIELPPDFVT